MFEALRILKARKMKFRLSVIGEQFKNIPDVFHSARLEFSDFIDRWGYQQHRHHYEAALLEADVFVSTADHEFFGISVLEAAAAGAFPLVPEKLAYPETLELDAGNEEFFFKGGADELADRLIQLSGKIQDNNLWDGDPDRAVRIVEKFYWGLKANSLDQDISDVLTC
jgi:glycosyltransferase involved in cell wall biosynthesis